jgi:ABC-type nitrate/sulfonate/bicarbonate transport system ATPase subunit
MIRLSSLGFAYPNLAELFEDFSLEILQGETWAILGSSGCGKTTLLYLLAGLRFPTHGSIEINGQRLTRPRPRTGLILQDYGLLPWSTVRENVELGLQVRSFYGEDGKHTPVAFQPQNNVSYWLERLGIDDIAHKYPAQLSGGQRQRTAIARTLALEPDLLLMDEPFSSLDAITREDLQNLTLSLCAEKQLTLVVVTHAIEEAAVLGKKILLLDTASNHTARIFDNSTSGAPGYRESKEYQELWSRLRRELQHETA